MRIRGYVSVNENEDKMLSLDYSSVPAGWKTYTFEIEVPHPLVELKVIPESVEEVK